MKNLRYDYFIDFKGHLGSANSIEFSPDGKYMASGSKDGNIKVWSLELKKELTTLKGHKQAIISV